MKVRSFQRTTEASFPENESLPKKDEDTKKFDKRFNEWWDDVKENLFTAKNSGLTTIWMTNEENQPSYIDKKIEKISDLLSL